MTQTARLKPDDRVEMNPLFLLRWEEAQNAHILLYPEGLVKLNDTAAAVLKHCQTAQTVSAVVDAMANAYGQNDIEDDVIDFLGVCLEKSWLRVTA